MRTVKRKLEKSEMLTNCWSPTQKMCEVGLHGAVGTNREIYLRRKDTFLIKYGNNNKGEIKSLEA